MSVAALPAALFPQQDAPLRGNDSRQPGSSPRRAASGKGVDDVDAPEDERESKDDAANASPDAFNELLAGLLNVSTPQPVESPPVQDAATETPAASSVDAVGDASTGAATNAAPTDATAINGANAQAAAGDSTPLAMATPAETPPSTTVDASAGQPENVSNAAMNAEAAQAKSSESAAQSDSAAAQATGQDAATPQADENQPAPEISADGSASEQPRSESRTESSSARDTSHLANKPESASSTQVEPNAQTPSAADLTKAGNVQTSAEVTTSAEKKAAPEKPAEVTHAAHELNPIEPVVQDVGAAAISAAANPAAPVGTSSSTPIAADHVSRQVVQAILTHETDVTTLGQRSFEMMLDPPELGRLMIQMSRGAKGLEVKISAEDDAVGAILKASGADLQQSLQLSSLSLGEFGTPTQSSSEQFTDSSADESPRGVSSVTRNRSFVPAQSAGRSSGALNVIV